MAQTVQGARSVAAKRQGITLEEYEARLAAGLCWCTRHKSWHPAEAFGVDLSRPIGKAASCLGGRQEMYQASYVPVPLDQRKPAGPPPGRMRDPEVRARISQGKKGRPNGRLGKRHSLETRALISQKVRERAVRGSQCHSYKDGKLAERRGLRFSLEAKRWRMDVFQRDGFTCQDCGDNRGSNLNAHHLKGWAEYPDLRFVLSNGLTLCKPCHKLRHASGKDAP